MLELRKVHGEVKPADVFPRHMQSRENIRQLMTLYGRECREGRAAAAPQFRRNESQAHFMDSVTEEGLEDNAPIHDASVLSLEYGERAIDRYFPKAVASDLLGASCHRTRMMMMMMMTTIGGTTTCSPSAF